MLHIFCFCCWLLHSIFIFCFCFPSFCFALPCLATNVGTWVFLFFQKVSNRFFFATGKFFVFSPQFDNNEWADTCVRVTQNNSNSLLSTPFAPCVFAHSSSVCHLPFNATFKCFWFFNEFKYIGFEVFIGCVRVPVCVCVQKASQYFGKASKENGLNQISRFVL